MKCKDVFKLTLAHIMAKHDWFQSSINDSYACMQVARVRQMPARFV